MSDNAHQTDRFSPEESVEADAATIVDSEGIAEVTQETVVVESEQQPDTTAVFGSDNPALQASAREGATPGFSTPAPAPTATPWTAYSGPEQPAPAPQYASPSPQPAQGPYPGGPYPGQAYPGQPYPGQPYPQEAFTDFSVQQVPWSPKSKLASGLFGILLGMFGVHNFYLGYTGKAIAQLLITVLSFGVLSFVSAIWGLVEGILILAAEVGTKWDLDALGRPMRPIGATSI